MPDDRKTIEEAIALLDRDLELHVDETDAWLTKRGFDVSMLFEGISLKDFVHTMGGTYVEARDADVAVRTLLLSLMSGGSLVWFEFHYFECVRESGRVVRVPLAEDCDIVRHEIAVPSFSTIEELRMKLEIGGKTP